MVLLSTTVKAVIGLPVGLLVTAWAWYQWTHRRRLAIARRIPTVDSTLPIIGSFQFYMFSRFTNVGFKNNVFLKMMTVNAESGVTCFWIGPLPLIIVHRPDYIQKLLTSSKSLHKSPEYDLSRFYLGDGLVTAPVHIWKKTRRQINHVFHHRNIEQFVPYYNVQAELLVRNLSELVGTGQRDVLPYFVSFSLGNVFRIMFGDVNFDPYSDSSKHMMDVVNVTLLGYMKRVYKPWLHPGMVFDLVSVKLKKTVQEVFKGYIEPLLLQAISKRDLKEHVDETTKLNGRHEAEGNVRSEPLILADAFASLEQMNPSFGSFYRQTEIQTIIGAGSETSSVTLASCLLALGTHPEVQEKLYQEVIEVVGTTFKHVTITDINNMRYMDQVLKESLRKFLVVPTIGRTCSEDMNLGDVTIPANTPVYISIVSLHKNPEYYPDPDKFDPDRFSAENVAKRPRCSFLPFSSGPRDCIGGNYAMITMKIALSHILREFKVYTDVNVDDMKYNYKICMCSSEGYNVRLERR